MIYEFIDGKYPIVVRHNDDGTDTFIPIDEANSDYQAYLNPEVEHLTEIPTPEQSGTL